MRTRKKLIVHWRRVRERELYCEDTKMRRIWRMIAIFSGAATRAYSAAAIWKS